MAESYSEADFQQQQIYWWVSCTLMWISFFLTSAAVYEWQHNEAYKKDMFKGFIPVFIGNIGFIVAFLPFHTYNAFSSAINGENFGVVENEEICQVTTLLGPVLYMMYSWFGMTMVAYALHETVKAALRADPSYQVMTRKVFVFAFLFPLGLSLVYYSVDFDNIGSYRGLYCLWFSFNLVNAGFGIVAWLIFGSVMVFFYVNSYRMLHGHFSSMGISTSDGARGAINNMITLAIKFVIIFVICGTPFLIEVTWGLVSEPPIEFSMFAGWMLKVKCCLDPVLILTMPAVKKTRAEIKERKQTLTAGTGKRTTLTGTDTSEGFRDSKAKADILRVVPIESASSDV